MEVRRSSVSGSKADFRARQLSAREMLRGSLEERRFCAFFLDPAGVLRACVSIDWPRDVRRSLPLIRREVAPDRAALSDPAIDLRTLDPARA